MIQAPLFLVKKDVRHYLLLWIQSQTHIYHEGVRYMVDLENNKLISLDGDTYSERYEVIGYETWANEAEGVKPGLSIWI